LAVILMSDLYGKMLVSELIELLTKHDRIRVSKRNNRYDATMPNGETIFTGCCSRTIAEKLLQDIVTLPGIEGILWV